MTIQKYPDCLRLQVEQATKINITECYQCGKCTAGCPLNGDMDIMPNQILRMMQLELPNYENKILKSLSIWLCLNCDMCYSRCPQEIKLSEIMDFFRQKSLRENKVNPKAKDILKFNQSFLENIEKNGKMNEIGLTINYKLKTFNLIQDVRHAPSMFFKGKLRLFPHKVQNIKEIKRLFRKTISNEGGSK